MAYSKVLLATIVVIAFLGIASAVNNPVTVDISVTVPFVTQKKSDIVVRGLISCIRDNDKSKWIPLEGATAKLYCPLFQTKSTFADKNGFFLVKLPSDRFSNDCRVYLDSPGPDANDCIVPSDENHGIFGDPITPTKEHPELYQVGPFFYTNPQL
ncbi:uncharacterized protein LOC110727934 [Chenopodium quinoa]|uniref:uncharacterized protein LOC110727934 n=1 Tax=Chenopodium quinoa TaxID=63459 RepID=UPI000B76EF13|nr:uncharacterized protein LOC110727934 [Chenopodium quinoa]